MFSLGAGVNPLGTLLHALGELFIVALIGRALLSWFPVSYDSPFNGVRRVLFSVTEPVLAPFRRLIPPMGGFDLSFLVCFLVVSAIVGNVLPRL